MSAFAPIVAENRVAVRRLVISRDADGRAAVAAAADLLGWPEIELHGSAMATAALPIQYGTPPAMLMVDLDGEAEPLAALARLTAPCIAETRIIAFGSADDVVLFRALRAAGVDDYLVKPLDPAVLAEAMLAAAARSEALAPATVATARSIAVMGVRGGCGASMLAASLAWTLAHQRRERTTLVDLDLHFGNLAFGFGLEPDAGLAAMLAGAQFDGAVLAAARQNAGDRLQVVATKQPLDNDMAVPPAMMAALLAELRHDADWLVAELPRRIDAGTRAVLATADAVVLVAPPSLEGLRDAVRMHAYVEGLRTDATAPLMVINGAVGGASVGAGAGVAAGGEIGRRMFEDALGERLAAWIPAYPGPAAAAAAHMLPLAALVDGARRGGGFTALAERIADGNTPPAPAAPAFWTAEWWLRRR